MKREIVHINEDLCDGCGVCIPNCHEGALQIIDGKARLVSDLMCDGLGACIGHCPKGAISIEKRESESYNESKVMERMTQKGLKTVLAHLKHLREHKETEYLKEGMDYIRKNRNKLEFTYEEVIQQLQGNNGSCHSHSGNGCPGSKEMNFQNIQIATPPEKSQVHTEQRSELMQWPVQLHLLNPSASYFQNADVLITADCVAYALGNFHQAYLKGKSLAIACPKLDTGIDIYVEKIRAMIDDAQINTLQVMIMEVPCCGGLLKIAKQAVSMAERIIPVKVTVVSVQGKVLKEEWIPTKQIAYETVRDR